MTRLSEIQERWAKVRPWFWWTSNSYRRLGTRDQDHVVMYAAVCRDGVGTIEGDESALDAIASAPSDIAWLIARVRELEAHVADVEAQIACDNCGVLRGHHLEEDGQPIESEGARQRCGDWKPLSAIVALRREESERLYRRCIQVVALRDGLTQSIDEWHRWMHLAHAPMSPPAKELAKLDRLRSLLPKAGEG